jgi:hypothetical protein
VKRENGWRTGLGESRPDPPTSQADIGPQIAAAFAGEHRRYRTIGGVARTTDLPMEVVATYLAEHPDRYRRCRLSLGGQPLYARLNGKARDPSGVRDTDRSRRSALLELVVVCMALWVLLLGFFLLVRLFKLPPAVGDIGMFVFGNVAAVAVTISLRRDQ